MAIKSIKHIGGFWTITLSFLLMHPSAFDISIIVHKIQVKFDFYHSSWPSRVIPL